MRYQKLTAEQKSVRNWRLRRNRLVCKLLDENPRMPREDALKMANKLLRKKHP